MSTQKYICETELPHDEILAGMADGSLQPWRGDSDGRAWFVRAEKTIHAVPAPGKEIVADDDADDDALDSGVADYTAMILAERELAERRYQSMLFKRAGGADIPPELGAEILLAAGKSMEQFNNDLHEAREVLMELGEL